MAGVSGAAAGVIAEDAGENAPLPCSEIAATLKRYEVPVVNPRTVDAVVGETSST